MPKPDLYLENHRAAPEPIRRYIGECGGCNGEIFLGDRYLRDAYWECVVHDDNECIRLLLEKQGFTEGG
jgi:hypothetical protein